MNGNRIFIFAVILLFACNNTSVRQEQDAMASTKVDTLLASEPKIPELSGAADRMAGTDLLDLQKKETEYGFEGQGWYKRLEGTIGGLPVTVHLVKNGAIKNPFDSIPTAAIHGYYYYNKYQQPIPIYQYQPDPDQDMLDSKLVLYENFTDAQQNQWRVSYNNDGPGFYEGSWHNGTNGKKLSIYLEEVLPNGSESLQAYWLADLQSTPLANGNQSDALLNLGMLFPDIDNDKFNADLAYGIIWRIIPAFANADLAERAGGADEVLQGLHEQFFGAHQEEMELLKESPDLMAGSFMEKKMSVVWNDNLHLCLAIESYQSMNDASTTTQTKFLNIDLETWYGIFLDDVFKEGYESSLEQAVREAAKRAFEKDPNGDPAEAVNAKVVENYAITNKGIWFSYEPYHFDAFGPEEYKIFVTFEKMAAFVKPYWLGQSEK